MKTFNLLCSNPKAIVPFIKGNKLDTFPTIFIQIYSGIIDKGMMKVLISEIKSVLPCSQIAGATTDGEICNGKITTNQVAVSFLVFEKTTIQTNLYHLENYTCLDSLGKDITRQMVTPRSKLLLLLANSSQFDLEDLVNGLKGAKGDTKILGALAGANGDLGRTYVSLNENITESGVVAVALESDDLLVHSYTNHRWKEIGTKFTITESDKNIINKIDNKNPLKIITKYLGKQFIADLPQSGVQFPLMTVRDGRKTSINVTKILDGGAIRIDRSVQNGEQFTFSYADAEGIIETAKEHVKELVTKPVESILIFNCMVKRRYLDRFVQKEMGVLQQIAPTFGFFSYGEIDSSVSGEVDYISFSTINIALSETNEVKSYNIVDVDYSITEESKGIRTLSHLINASSQDIVKLYKNLERSEQKYKSLFEHNSDIVFSIDLFGRILSVNPRFSEIFGFTEKQIIKKSALTFLKQKDIERVTNHFYKALEGDEQTYEIDLKERDGQDRTYLIKHIPIIINGERTGVYGIGRDITAQKKAEERVAYLAYYDTATSLPNRQNFSERLSGNIQELKLKKDKEKIAVLFIDFDRFKIINDSLGHIVGDELLRLMIERISKILPPNSYFARFGGDKFTLSFSDFRNIDEVINLGQTLLSSINKSVVYKEQEFYVTASIGVSLFPNDGLTEDSLLKNADTALNQAKTLGGNRIKFYSNDMNRQALFRIELEGYLRRALEKREFFLCYQPFIDIQKQSVLGAEALLRWDHPKLGLVSPAEFIPLAEETGLIIDIGIWVLRTSCLHAKKWQEKGYGNLCISVNVSAHQFQHPTFIDEVKKALEVSGLSPCFLQLELTESAMLRNATLSISIMEELQGLGVQLSVDDFGTGYSSLSYLRDLPINNLKIDRSFIKNLRFDSKDVAIANAIITMGKGLNLKVIAEGIESEEQLNILQNLSCDVAQGFYLSKPKVLEEFEAYMEQRLPSLSS